MISKLNKSIFIYIFLLAIISILSIYCASIYTSLELGNLVIKQCVWYIVGFIFVFGVIKFKKFILNNVWLLYSLGIMLLVLLLIFGVPINGSKCWFVIPGIGSVQPSEFMKIFIMLSLSSLIADFRNGFDTSSSIKSELLFIIKSLIVVIIPSILTFLQPDTGAVIIYLVIYIFMMFTAGIRIRWFFIAFVLFFLLIGGCSVIYFFDETLFTELFGISIYYRIERLFMWKYGVGLQLENAISAIGSAGFLGHGLKNTPIYFPESSTDFIFAVYASNFGFLGVCVFLLVLFSFDIYIGKMLFKNKNYFSRAIISGILGMILFQQVQNIGMTIGLFPITGITLPFVSYGGSSLLSYMIVIGLLLNISIEKNCVYIK